MEAPLRKRRCGCLRERLHVGDLCFVCPYKAEKFGCCICGVEQGTRQLLRTSVASVPLSLFRPGGRNSWPVVVTCRALCDECDNRADERARLALFYDGVSEKGGRLRAS